MVHHQFKLFGASLALAIGLFGGFASADDGADSAVDGVRASHQPGEQEGQITVRSDGEIAQILSANNQAEIAEAKVALTRGKSKLVRAFAQEMIDAHSKSQQRQTELYRSQRIKTEKSQIGSLIGGHSSAVVKYLRKQPEGSFDRVFISLQVLRHRFALQVLDRQLIPNVTDKALRAELQRVRTELAAHLKQAQAIRAQLRKGKAISPPKHRTAQQKQT